jgi:putative drug exporter of the RND superfamily
MERLTRWVLGHRKLVVGIWLVLTVAGMATAGTATKRMDQRFTVPGKEGWETNQTIARTFKGTGGDTTPLLAVVTASSGKIARDDMAGVERRLTAANPGSRTAGFASTGSNAFVSEDGRTAFVITYPPLDPKSTFGENVGAEKRARAALKGVTVGGAPVHLTGYDALSAETGGGDGPGVLVEAVVGGLGALVVLAFVFGSLLAIVPLLMAIPAIMISFLAVLGLTTFTGVSPIVQFLIALIGLGVAIDYSLLLVVRWREELARGADGDEAIVNAMNTAGRAVVFSGTTVGIGLLALVVLPLPFLRSVGYGGMLIPIVSVLVAITLLPVILHSLGRRLDWPHRRTDEQASRGWTRWATGIVKRRWLSAGVALVILAALAVAATGMRPGFADVNTVSKQGDAEDGLVALNRSGIGSGALLPHEMLVRGGSPSKLVASLNGLDGIHGTVAPAGKDWHSGGTSVVDAFPVPDISTSASKDLLASVRATARKDGGAVGGNPASNADFISAVYGSFPLMIVLIAVITFILLARAFRSLCCRPRRSSST